MLVVCPCETPRIVVQTLPGCALHVGQATALMMVLSLVDAIDFRLSRLLYALRVRLQTGHRAAASLRALSCFSSVRLPNHLRTTRHFIFCLLQALRIAAPRPLL